MKKIIKQTSIIFIAIIITTIVAILYVNHKNNSNLTIINESQRTVFEMALKYDTSDETIEIGELKSKEKYEYKIKTDREDSISLNFIDSNNVEYNEVIIGYTYPDMKGIKVIIKENEKDDSLYLEIK